MSQCGKALPSRERKTIAGCYSLGIQKRSEISNAIAFAFQNSHQQWTQQCEEESRRAAWKQHKSIYNITFEEQCKIRKSKESCTIITASGSITGTKKLLSTSEFWTCSIASYFVKIHQPYSRSANYAKKMGTTWLAGNDYRFDWCSLNVFRINLIRNPFLLFYLTEMSVATILKP